ncbi:hypothetical protein ABKV19_007274 [Rosa sericea]
MSFQFRKPVPASTSTSSDSGSDKIHYKLMRHSGPDYDELIIPLSLYAFNRLSPSDQQEQLEEIRSHHEESDFTELFKKLKYHDQLELLYKVLKRFKCERLIPSFKQLDAEHQQQVIQQLAHVLPSSSSLWSLHRYSRPSDLLRGPEETEEDFRLRRFTQLCTDRAWDAHKLIVSCKSEDDEQEKTSDDDNENNSDWKSCFSEFFLGFSIIWFQGQWASRQDMLIEQLSKEFTGVVIEKSLQNECEEDFKLRIFKELCTKVIDFRVQEQFLDNAVGKLERCVWDSWPMILEPQEFDRAAELLSDLSTLGFGLLSAKYQQHKIDEMSIQVESGVETKRRLAAEDLQTSTTDPEEEEAVRMRRFTELFNQVPVRTRIDLFEDLRKVLLKQKRYSEAVHFFCGLGSKDQAKMIEKLAHRIRDSAELIRLEKFSGESEEDLRLRRFKKVCSQHLSTWDYIVWPEADKKRVQQGTSDHNEEESPYAEFLFDVSITWFKARCANYRRNPIHVILSGQVEVIEKLPEEGEEDFRLRRFTESFKRLEFTSKERVVDYIQDTLFDDLGYPVPQFVFESYEPPAEGRGSFDSEWIKMKLPNLQGQGATATTPQGAPVGGSATTTQAGGGIVNRR